MKKIFLILIIFTSVAVISATIYLAEGYIFSNANLSNVFTRPAKPVVYSDYANNEFGFKMTFPDSWAGSLVVKNSWQGRVINTGEQKYSGAEIIIKNPKTTSQQQWQDIPIMVFTPDVWKLASGPNAEVAVSAAPIGPEKIGENANYIFATPPRWYGFTDAIGFGEAVNIVKTFKAF